MKNGTKLLLIIIVMNLMIKSYALQSDSTDYNLGLSTTTYYDTNNMWVFTSNISDLYVGDGWNCFLFIYEYAVSSISFNKIQINPDQIENVKLKFYIGYFGSNGNINNGYPSFEMPNGIFNPPLYIQQIYFGSTFDPDINEYPVENFRVVYPDSLNIGWNEVDITDFIAHDLALDRDNHQIRLKFPIKYDEDLYDDGITIITIGDNSLFPKLIYTYENSNHSNENIIERELINISNYPNPFNPRTTINFSIPKTDLVNIEIYNVKGQKVKGLLSEVKQKGEYAIDWNGEDSQGISCSSGIYFCRIETSSAKKMHKMILMK
ncbi:MAG: T9SS type A sorting domain-containing protein [Candidatus Cloacimonetes bacterium]|jgi:hypothetical protein|nr:T9SS type A sorting domain-containing protein [Candidatus Cloacimonadota bacterium]